MSTEQRCRALTLPSPAQLKGPSCTCVAGRTAALVVVHVVEAGAVVAAGPGRALVDVDLAVGALEAGHTEAAVLARAVPADGPVPARPRRALVDVVPAHGPAEAGRAEAAEAACSLHARAVVQAGLAGAHGALCLAAFSPRALLAPAGVSSCCIHTFKPGWARAALTLINTGTGGTCRASCARTFVFQESWARGAAHVGRTVMFSASIIEVFTIFAHVGYRLHRADALVTHFQILAAPPILTWGRGTATVIFRVRRS